jgi:hypothetical protein
MSDRKLSASTELAEEPASGDLFPVLDISDGTDAATGTLKKILWSTLKAIFAVAAKGVTNGDSHDHAGGDGAAITESAIALADNTTNDVTTSKHGLVPKATAPAANYMNHLGIINGESSPTMRALFDASNPADCGTAAPGISTLAAHRDHVHAVPAASDTVAGKVELATAGETTTGTDTTRAVTPDGIAGSDFGKRIIQIKVMDDATSLTTGDGKINFCIPPELNGMNLVDADAFVSTVATGATLITIQIRNVTDSADFLSTKITINASAYTSYTATTPPVIDTAHDDVATGDLVSIDIDAIGNTTPGKGLGVILSFQLP